VAAVNLGEYRRCGDVLEERDVGTMMMVMIVGIFR